MKLSRAPRRTQPETIVALIDVVFFLLVFFMLIGRMDATAPFEVVPATAGTGIDMPGGGLTLAVSTTGMLALDGEQLERSAALRRVAEKMIEAPSTMVRVNADHAAALSDVLPLVAELEASGAGDIFLVVTPPRP